MIKHSYNNPQQSYWNISKLSASLLHHCEKYNIVIWAEFGSLIALKRHCGGIIPWDYDGDFGIFVRDKQKFIETYSKEKEEDIILNIDYYHDEGCLALHLVDNDSDIVDLIFYQEFDEVIDSMQNDATKIEYPSNDGYCYNKSDFYPLSKKLFLGHTVYVPHQWEKILAIHYENWREYPTEFINYIVPKFLEPPYKSIPKFHINNFDDLKKIVEDSKSPVILKKTDLLSCDVINYESIIRSQRSNVYGYQSSITWEKTEKPAPKVWKDYLGNKLDFNIVDSPIDNKFILSENWTKYAKQKLGTQFEFALTWVMTNAPKVTHFHIDPEYAGGFMKLLFGEKIWWCVAPDDYQYLIEKGHTIESMAQLQLHEMLQLENCYLFGKIFVDVISEGDLIWFPIKTLHKVITTKNSYGFGGYL